MSYTTTGTYTYSVTDIEAVVRRFLADIVMIAQSSQAITEAKARDYAHDVELLATHGYLQTVDLTLFDGTTEVRATRYTVSTAAGDLVMSRPGGVMWPRVASPYFRIVLFHTEAYDDAVKAALQRQLKIGWGPISADTSHASLAVAGGRDYASNGWGMQRKDYGA